MKDNNNKLQIENLENQINLLNVEIGGLKNNVKISAKITLLKQLELELNTLKRN
ncbi:MAG: hypothetical protein JKY03_10045 [Aureispira sp.]|nr:hypothetical protein [Aureispira sp.]